MLVTYFDVIFDRLFLTHFVWYIIDCYCNTAFVCLMMNVDMLSTTHQFCSSNKIEGLHMRPQNEIKHASCMLEEEHISKAIHRSGVHDLRPQHSETHAADILG
jgi:hypothetical protein